MTKEKDLVKQQAFRNGNDKREKIRQKNTLKKGRDH